MAEKKERTIAKGNLTRNVNQLSELLDEDAPLAMVSPQYDKVKKCWERLEVAHDAFISAVDEEAMDIETDKDGLSYIDAPNATYKAVVKRYAAYLKLSNETVRAETTQKAAEERAAVREDQRQIKSTRERRKVGCVRNRRRRNSILQQRSSSLQLTLSLV